MNGGRNVGRFNRVTKDRESSRVTVDDEGTLDFPCGVSRETGQRPRSCKINVLDTVPTRKLSSWLNRVSDPEDLSPRKTLPEGPNHLCLGSSHKGYGAQITTR